MSERILVTGASGFVGQALCRELRLRNFMLTMTLRKLRVEYPDCEQIIIPELNEHTDWSAALKDMAVVVHLAARVHVMDEQAADPLDEFRRMNVGGTVNLARQAAAAGVKRFVFLSSIKVNGEFTKVGIPFTADDVPAPEDPYGISKHEAELALQDVSAQTGMEVVIIRPPLVYGPGVKANFAAMMRWLARGVPLPLGAITHNRRSLVALDNLVDLIVTCLQHPAAANQTFLVSDGDDLSTYYLLKQMGLALDRPSRLFYVPPILIKFGTMMLNKPGIYQRLCGSLQLDITKTRQLLDWCPPVSVAEGLRRAAVGFRK